MDLTIVLCHHGERHFHCSRANCCNPTSKLSVSVEMRKRLSLSVSRSSRHVVAVGTREWQNELMVEVSNHLTKRDVPSSRVDESSNGWC